MKGWSIDKDSFDWEPNKSASSRVADVSSADDVVAGLLVMETPRYCPLRNVSGSSFCRMSEQCFVGCALALPMGVAPEAMFDSWSRA